MQKLSSENPQPHEIRNLFRGSEVSDEALYAMYSEALDIFHGFHPDDSRYSVRQKQQALQEMSEIGAEAVRRGLVEGITFHGTERTTLVQQELEKLRNAAKEPTDTHLLCITPEPPMLSGAELRKSERREPAAGKRTTSKRNAPVEGQLGLFG